MSHVVEILKELRAIFASFAKRGKISKIRNRRQWDSSDSEDEHSDDSDDDISEESESSEEEDSEDERTYKQKKRRNKFPRTRSHSRTCSSSKPSKSTKSSETDRGIERMKMPKMKDDVVKTLLNKFSFRTPAQPVCYFCMNEDGPPHWMYTCKALEEALRTGLVSRSSDNKIMYKMRFIPSRANPRGMRGWVEEQEARAKDTAAVNRNVSFAEVQSHSVEYDPPEISEGSGNYETAQVQVDKYEVNAGKRTCDDTQGRSACTGRRRVLDKLCKQDESILTSTVSETGLKIPVYSTRSSSPFVSQAGPSHSREAPASSDKMMSDEQSDARVARWSVKDVGPVRKNKNRKLAQGRKTGDKDAYRPPAPRKARTWKASKSPGSSSSSARSQGSRKSEGSEQPVKSHRSSGTREVDRPIPIPHLDKLLAQAERLNEAEDSIMREREGQDVLQEIFETRTGPWIHTCSPDEAAERAAILREERFRPEKIERFTRTLAPALPIHAHAPPRNSRECSSMMFSVRVPGDVEADLLSPEPRENSLEDESHREQNEDIEVMDVKAPEPEFDFQEWVNDRHAQIYEPEEENDPRAGIQTFCAQNGDIVIEESVLDSGASDLSEERLISELGLRMAETGLASNFMELAFDDESSEEDCLEADDDSLSNDFAMSGDITYEMLDRYPRLDDPSNEDPEGSSEIYSISNYEYDIGLRDEFGQLTDGPIFIDGEWRTYELEDDFSGEEECYAKYVAYQVGLESLENQDEPTIEEVSVTELPEETEAWRTFDLTSAPSNLEDQTCREESLSGLIGTFVDDRISEELEQAARHRVLRRENLGAANLGDGEDLLFGVSSVDLLDVDGRASQQFKGEEASLTVAREIRLANTGSLDSPLGEDLSELEKDRLVLKELREDLRRTFFEVQASREGKTPAPSKDEPLPSAEKLAPPPPHDSTAEDPLKKGSLASTTIASFRNFLREQVELEIVRDMTAEEESDLLARTHREEGFTDYQNLMRRAILRMEMEWLTSELDHMLADHAESEARETQEEEQGSLGNESDCDAHERVVKNQQRRQLILEQIMEVERTLWGRIDTLSKSEALAEEWAPKGKKDVFPESSIPETTAHPIGDKHESENSTMEGNLDSNMLYPFPFVSKDKPEGKILGSGQRTPAETDSLPRSRGKDFLEPKDKGEIGNGLTGAGIDLRESPYEKDKFGLTGAGIDLRESPYEKDKFADELQDDQTGRLREELRERLLSIPGEDSMPPETLAYRVTELVNFLKEERAGGRTNPEEREELAVRFFLGNQLGGPNFQADGESRPWREVLRENLEMRERGYIFDEEWKCWSTRNERIPAPATGEWSVGNLAEAGDLRKWALHEEWEACLDEQITEWQESRWAEMPTAQELERRMLEAEAESGNSGAPTVDTPGLTYDYQQVNIQEEDGASNQGAELRTYTMTLSSESSDEEIIVEAPTLLYKGGNQEILPERSRQVNLAEVREGVKYAESELIRLEERIEDAYQRFAARLRNQIDSRESGTTSVGSTPWSKLSDETIEALGDQTVEAPDESENELWHVKPRNAMEYNLRKGMTHREVYREELFIDDETARGRGSVRWITSEDWEDEMQEKEVGLRVGEMKIPPTAEDLEKERKHAEIRRFLRANTFRPAKSLGSLEEERRQIERDITELEELKSELDHLIWKVEDTRKILKEAKLKEIRDLKIAGPKRWQRSLSLPNDPTPRPRSPDIAMEGESMARALEVDRQRRELAAPPESPILAPADFPTPVPEEIRRLEKEVCILEDLRKGARKAHLQAKTDGAGEEHVRYNLRELRRCLEKGYEEIICGVNSMILKGEVSKEESQELREVSDKPISENNSLGTWDGYLEFVARAEAIPTLTEKEVERSAHPMSTLPPGQLHLTIPMGLAKEERDAYIAAAISKELDVFLQHVAEGPNTTEYVYESHSAELPLRSKEGSQSEEEILRKMGAYKIGKEPSREEVSAWWKEKFGNDEQAEGLALTQPWYLWRLWDRQRKCLDRMMPDELAEENVMIAKENAYLNSRINHLLEKHTSRYQRKDWSLKIPDLNFCEGPYGSESSEGPSGSKGSEGPCTRGISKSEPANKQARSPAKRPTEDLTEALSIGSQKKESMRQIMRPRGTYTPGEIRKLKKSGIEVAWEDECESEDESAELRGRIRAWRRDVHRILEEKKSKTWRSESTDKQASEGGSETTHVSETDEEREEVEVEHRGTYMYTAGALELLQGGLSLANQRDLAEAVLSADPGAYQDVIYEVNTKYKPVGKKVLPIPIALPTTDNPPLRRPPLSRNPYQTPLTPYMPLFEPGGKLTEERLALMDFGPEGWLSGDERNLILNVLRLQEKALAFDGTERAAVTICDAGFPPVIEEFIEDFTGCACLGLMDVYGGYDQRELAEESRDLTTFQTPLGPVRLTRLPQGATNSVAEYQRVMVHVLAEEIPEFAGVFVDDVGVKGPTTTYGDEKLKENPEIRRFIWEYAVALERVLFRFEEAGLTVSGPKAAVVVPALNIVGTVCSLEGRRMSKSSKNKVSEFPIPRDVTEVRGFLGICTYVRTWIEKFADVARPLRHLTRNGVEFLWTDECQKSFEKLKEIVGRDLLLAKLQYGPTAGKIILAVDSSHIAAGGVIFQEDAKGKRQPARYESLTFTETESRYSQPKLELAGVAKMLKKLQMFLWGQHFTLEIDASALVQMINAPELPNAPMNR
ncbi:hypothetical protein P7C70_g6832, partial [Phenoliferia sp. Uapishka_3]